MCNIISKLLQEEKIFQYQIDMLEDAKRKISFKNKIVLEIGGSNLPRELVFDWLKIKKIVCIDLIAKYQVEKNKEHYKNAKFVNIDDENLSNIIEDNDYIIIEADAANINEKLYSKFDICISMCCFEHILKLDKVISNVYLSLKNDGILFTQFGPIYSCKYGSHYWYDDNSNFNIQENELDYIHLFKNNEEIHDFLFKTFDNDKALIIYDQICISDRINRFFYEDYVDIMNNSKFDYFECAPKYKLDIEFDILKKLKEIYPTKNNFNVYSLEIYAKKL